MQSVADGSSVNTRTPQLIPGHEPEPPSRDRRNRLIRRARLRFWSHIDHKLNRAEISPSLPARPAPSLPSRERAGAAKPSRGSGRGPRRPAPYSPSTLITSRFARLPSNST
jgi:hypothetical protein